MTANEQDWVVVFNIKRSKKASRRGDFKEIGGVPCSTVAMDRPTPPTSRFSTSPHGINTAPDGIHVSINGKLSPTFR